MCTACACVLHVHACVCMYLDVTREVLLGPRSSLSDTLRVAHSTHSTQ